MRVIMMLKPSIFKESGMSLPTALVMIAILSVLSATFISGVIYEGKNAQHWRKSAHAFYLAEAAGHKAVKLLKDEAVEDFPYLENDVDLGNGRYDLEINFESRQSGAYTRDTYTIKGIGKVGESKRGIETGYQQDTFLRFSRFVQSSNSNLSYSAYAVLSGDVWAGNNLNLNGYPVTFLRDVSVGGVINNYSNGIFYGDVIQGVDTIDLETAVDLTYYTNLAQGNIPDKGTGIYNSSSSTIDLSLFDFSGPIPKYDGSNLTADFNGVVYVNGDAYVKGTLEGGSITVIASDDVVVTDHVRAGNMATGWEQTNPPIVFNSVQGVEQTETVYLNDIITADTTVVKMRTSGRKWNQMKMELMEDGTVIGETYLVRRPGSPNEQMAVISNLSLDPSVHSYSAKIYYKSDGNGANPTWIRAYTGDPVNIGLVAKDKVYLHSETPRQLVIDAALLARDSTWKALGNSSSHPSEYDSSWKLTINGPIITAVGGSAGPWASYGGTRKYNYDEDIVSYQPPHFPVPFGGWERIFWKEIKPKDII